MGRIATLLVLPLWGAGACGTGDVGSGGQALTDASADRGDAPSTVQPSVVSVRRESSSELHVELDGVAGVYGIWAEYCERDISLLKRDPTGTGWIPLADDSPVFCSGAAYYLGDRYQSNTCLGCDGGDPCHELSPTFNVRTRELVNIGMRPAPDGGAPGPDGGTALVPVIEERDTRGPYLLVVPYHAGPNCAGPQDHEFRLELEVE